MRHQNLRGKHHVHDCLQLSTVTGMGTLLLGSEQVRQPHIGVVSSPRGVGRALAGAWGELAAGRQLSTRAAAVAAAAVAGHVRELKVMRSSDQMGHVSC